MINFCNNSSLISIPNPGFSVTGNDPFSGSKGSDKYKDFFLFPCSECYIIKKLGVAIENCTVDATDSIPPPPICGATGIL